MRRGTTLVEVLIACSLLGLFLAMVATAVGTALHGEANAQSKIGAFREGSNVLERIDRELRMCIQVMSPDPTSTFPEGATWSPVVGTQAPFVFQYTTDTGTVNTVLYQLDPTTHEIQRCLYQPYTVFNLGNPTQTPPIPVASGVTQFVITRLAKTSTHYVPFLQLDLYTGNGTSSYWMTSTVQVVGLVQNASAGTP